MTLLSKEQILGAARKDFKDVDVPELGGTVRVRGLSAAEFIEYEQAIRDEDFANLRARLVANAAVDENGKPLFTAADVRALGEKPAKPIDRLFRAIITLTGFTDDAVEEAEKNSESGQS